MYNAAAPRTSGVARKSKYSSNCSTPSPFRSVCADESTIQCSGGGLCHLIGSLHLISILHRVAATQSLTLMVRLCGTLMRFRCAGGGTCGSEELMSACVAHARSSVSTPLSSARSILPELSRSKRAKLSSAIAQPL